MEAQRQLLELESYPPFKAFLAFVNERSQEHLREACYLADIGKPSESSAHLSKYNELKDLWSTFRNSYETETNSKSS